MKYSDLIVSGEPARIVTGVDLLGQTMKQKTDFFKQNHDGLRVELMAGEVHQGAVLTDSPEAGAVGAVFINRNGYPSMCGHAAMAIGALGHPLIDTSAGQVGVRMMGDKLAYLTNVPSFYYALLEVQIPPFPQVQIPPLGRIPVHLVFGGDFFALVNVVKLPLEFSKDNLEEVVKAALHIFSSVKGKQFRVMHPLRPWIDYIDALMLYKQVAEKQYLTLTAWGKDEYDLCPCGTGTSALLAMLRYFKLAGIGDMVENVSLVGNSFLGRIVSEQMVGLYQAVVPEIVGEVLGGKHEEAREDSAKDDEPSSSNS